MRTRGGVRPGGGINTCKTAQYDERDGETGYQGERPKTVDLHHLDDDGKIRRGTETRQARSTSTPSPTTHRTKSGDVRVPVPSQKRILPIQSRKTPNVLAGDTPGLRMYSDTPYRSMGTKQATESNTPFNTTTAP
ncbi:unnamed protein product, partial [Ectocarpus sp. 4 AP-2014]